MNSVAPVKALLTVWISLLVLLALTTASAYVPLGIGNSLANMAIATIKVGLVAIFFMRLRKSDNAVRLAAGAALLFLFFLAFLSFGDFVTRPLRPASWTPPAETSRAGGPY
jgi:caa(3)-type oxidase subunit IV